MRYVERASLPMKGNHDDQNELKRVFDHFKHERLIEEKDEEKYLYLTLLDTWNYFKARHCDIIKRVLHFKKGNTFLIQLSFINICECSNIPADQIIKNAGKIYSGKLLPIRY